MELYTAPWIWRIVRSAEPCERTKSIKGQSQFENQILLTRFLHRLEKQKSFSDRTDQAAIIVILKFYPTGWDGSGICGSSLPFYLTRPITTSVGLVLWDPNWEGEEAVYYKMMMKSFLVHLTGT